MDNTDQRLGRVAALQDRIREGLRRLNAHERHSEAWELCLALLIPLWWDLFALLQEVEDS